jgi:hypothetical protein
VECNGYLASGQVPQEQWFISPGFSTITYTDAKLNFVSCDKFNGTPMQVLVSTNYDGISLPSTANWVDITSQLTIAPPNPSSPRVWIPSGGMSLSSFVGNNVFVGFKYLCDSTTATDWEVDSISITSNLTGLNMHQGTNDQISVYPNPAVNHAEIRCASGMVRVELFNAIGNRVQTVQLLNGKQYQVDLSDLPTGIYFATVYTATGEQFCHKIVKQ